MTGAGKATSARVNREEARLQELPPNPSGVVPEPAVPAPEGAALHLAPSAGKPTYRGKPVWGAVCSLANEYSVPRASSVSCASSRTHWNLLPPPHCRAERSQAPRPQPAGPLLVPCSASSGRGPGPAPTPGAGWVGGGSAARPGLAEAHTAGGASPRTRRRVGAEPAAPAPRRAGGGGPPASAPPGQCPWEAAGTPQPIDPTRAACALWSPEPPESRAPPHPSPLTPKCTVPSGLSRPSHMARSTTPSDKSFPPNPLSAGDGFLLFLVGLLAGLGVPPRQERVCARPQAGPSPQCRAWQTPGARGRNAC